MQEISRGDAMIRTTRLLPLLLAAAALGAPAARAQRAAAPTAAAADYFPLAAGSTWTYALSSGGAPAGTADVRVVPVGSNAAGGVENYFGNGALSVVRETGVGTVVEGPAGTMLWYALAAPVGTRWTFRSSTATGGYSGTRVTLLSRTETVDVPAGHFDNCVKLGFLRLSGNAPGPIEETFAPGVGLVKRETVMGYTWELASGVVAGRHLPILPVEVSIALNRDGFIFAGPQPPPGPQPQQTIKVRLTVRSESVPETFHFDTTQRLNVRVRDVTGQEIWLWSTGQSFPGPGGDETAGPGSPLVYDVEIPVIQGGSGGGVHGTAVYQMEAILWDHDAASGLEGHMARALYSVVNAP
jgi:hypothetical protein